jgi:hypothetical protein
MLCARLKEEEVAPEVCPTEKLELERDDIDRVCEFVVVAIRIVPLDEVIRSDENIESNKVERSDEVARMDEGIEPSEVGVGGGEDGNGGGEDRNGGGEDRKGSFSVDGDPYVHDCIKSLRGGMSDVTAQTRNLVEKKTELIGVHTEGKGRKQPSATWIN